MESESVGVATVCLALSIVHAKKTQSDRKKKKFWIKPWLASRETDGAFHKLLKDLVNEPDDYKNYFRIDLPTFEELVMTDEKSNFTA
jgi:hypothetical protein